MRLSSLTQKQYEDAAKPTTRRINPYTRLHFRPEWNLLLGEASLADQVEPALPRTGRQKA